MGREERGGVLFPEKPKWMFECLNVWIDWCGKLYNKTCVFSVFEVCQICCHYIITVKKQHLDVLLKNFTFCVIINVVLLFFQGFPCTCLATVPLCCGCTGVITAGRMAGCLVLPLRPQHAGILHYHHPGLPPNHLLQKSELLRNRFEHLRTSSNIWL